MKTVSKKMVILISLILVAVIGTADYLTGDIFFFEAFYLLPVAMVVWRVNGQAGMAIALLSVVIWQAGDFAAGAQYKSAMAPFWNSAIVLAVYVVLILALVNLKRLQSVLEERVRQRTAALATEMQERTRLEKELVEIGEQSQRQVGQDLHDTLGQHLTATAFAAQVLTGQLEKASPSEAAAAAKVVSLIEEAIGLTRQFARGLQPVELKPEGLMDGFQELARLTSERFNLTCEFECREPVLLDDAYRSTHLYRIAQEAVTNAIKHGHAKFINLSLEQHEGDTRLVITDDGCGLPAAPSDAGLGLRIMEHRASMIGASFQIERLADSGTRVIVKLSHGQSGSKQHAG